MISASDRAALLAMADEWERSYFYHDVSSHPWRFAANQLRGKVVTLGEPEAIQEYEQPRTDS